VQRDREVILLRHFGEAANLRREAAGGHGDLARADVQPPRRVENFERPDEVVVVGERLAHAHHNDVVYQPPLRLGRLTALGQVPTLDSQHLIHDLGCVEVALVAHETACAKLAAVGATDLRRDTDRVPVASVAVPADGCRDQNALDQFPVGEAPEELHRTVPRALLLGQLEWLEQKRTGKLVAQLLRQIAHLVDRAGTLFVEPSEDLRHAIAFVPPLGEGALHLLGVERA